MKAMECKDALKQLRQAHGWSQDELAEKLFMTRQAISRWENGDTTPGSDVLKQLSALYDVSINTLLGSPRKLVCQCCGMPMTDGELAREPDSGAFREDYCKWCYVDGKMVYENLDELVAYLVSQHFIPGATDEQATAFYQQQLSSLQYWQSKKNQQEESTTQAN